MARCLFQIFFFKIQFVKHFFKFSRFYFIFLNKAFHGLWNLCEYLWRIWASWVRRFFFFFFLATARGWVERDREMVGLGMGDWGMVGMGMGLGGRAEGEGGKGRW